MALTTSEWEEVDALRQENFLLLEQVRRRVQYEEATAWDRMAGKITYGVLNDRIAKNRERIEELLARHWRSLPI